MGAMFTGLGTSKLASHAWLSVWPAPRTNSIRAMLSASSAVLPLGFDGFEHVMGELGQRAVCCVAVVMTNLQNGC